MFCQICWAHFPHEMGCFRNPPLVSIPPVTPRTDIPTYLCSIPPRREEFHTELGNGGQPMKTVTAFIGTARKKSTYNAVRQFLENLQLLGDVEYEIVVLNDHRLGICRGCKLCFAKGEEFCP